MAERLRFSPAPTGSPHLGGAHGLPVATIVALLGADEARERIGAALLG